MGLIAIGDIHGCAQSLERLLEKLDLQEEDHLVFIGDYIDRGPDSKGVIDQLLDLQARHQCTFLRGNHEALMLDALDGGDRQLWYVNGGTATIETYQQDGRVQIPEEHLAFVRETELYLDTPDFFFVHAGLKPHLSIAENLDRYGSEVFLWERSHMKAKEHKWEKPVVCGHTPKPQPIDHDRLIAIDTGCVYREHPQMGTLTAVRLPERTFVSVSCRP